MDAIIKPVCNVADPESGAFLTPGSGMGKNSGSGSGTGSEMNNPDHISVSSETIFGGFKYFNSLMRPGRKIRIREQTSRIRNTASMASLKYKILFRTGIFKSKRVEIRFAILRYYRSLTV